MEDERQARGQRRRVVWLGTVLALVGLALLGRLASWQLIPHPELEKWKMGNLPKVVPAARGVICDATGHYLVASTVTFSLAVSPRLLGPQQKEELIADLAHVLGRDKAEITHALEAAKRDYVLLANDLPAGVGRQLEDLKSDALAIHTKYKRVYPDDSLAASVLGFVDYLGQGRYGLEQYYESRLRGTEGKWYGVRDPWGRQIFLTLGGYQPARDGADLRLTLDRNVQRRAEEILRDGLEHNKATSGNIIVLDARTGAVLAMANYPSYSPAAYWEVESLDQFVNTAISWIYEPGSVFKPLTLAAALEARVIPPDYVYDDRGEILVGQQRIFNSDRKAHGPTSLLELLAYSRNVGAAHIAALLGETRFYEMLRRFGFGEVTGVDLSLEEEGIMRVPGDPAWHKSDLATNSFGQGISVTPLQVAAAYVPLANGGLLMRPYVVSEIRRGDEVQEIRPLVVRRVLREEVARYMQELMADSLALGMQQATLPGYRLAGKSGTASIADQEGYQSKEIIASFVGFGPLPNPRFVVLVKFDKPKEGYWGLEVAAPEFRRMCKFLFDYYGIPPSR